MLARAIEQAGVSTVAIVLIKEHAMRVKPPRALWVPFPFGFALGKPADPAFQHTVLAAALGLFEEQNGPVLADFPEDGDAPPRLLQASDALMLAKQTDDIDAADELISIRNYYERWIRDNAGRTAVGLTGIPHRRWRGLVKYLQGYADGHLTAYADKPSGMTEPRFIRLVSDDLKAFYMEARMSQRPQQIDNALQNWFWAETEMGKLLARVADRMNGSDDESTRRASFGIAR